MSIHVTFFLKQVVVMFVARVVMFVARVVMFVARSKVSKSFLYAKLFFLSLSVLLLFSNIYF